MTSSVVDVDFQGPSTDKTGALLVVAVRCIREYTVYYIEHYPGTQTVAEGE